MALDKVQRQALLAISGNRSPESHIGGGSVINRDSFRQSKDLDIFHDYSLLENRAKALSETVSQDIELLKSKGFSVHMELERPEFYRAVISLENDTTILEWIIHSDFRFFPAIKDDIFGYRLHMFDLATNKALTAAARREPRDILDLVYIDAHYFPLSAVIWAATAKDAGYTPESMIADIRRNSVYTQRDFDRVSTTQPVNAKQVALSLRKALENAEVFASVVPAEFEGRAFLMGGNPVEPNISEIEKYEILEARLQNPWPTSQSISSEMIASGPRKP